ncbi:glycosyltransferase family 2 protein [Otoolea muris]|uniref:glycosyltransferase family 2 protein n=1 Tax=Otoolea muris TaxID=2941515 RepID=UPI00203F4150|nr:glycosyltransferase [Otoolea muris]
MVSVILPVYNGEKFLSKAIESILGQSYQDLELIVVNDCSTDQTSEIVRGYSHQDSRIRIINNEVNMKLPASLNEGFKNSTGQFLTWTSDDNILKRDALAILMKNISDGADFVYSGMEYIDENGEMIDITDHLGEDIWYSNSIGACFLYKREIYDVLGGYDTSFFLVEDYEYWMRIAVQYKMKFIPDKLYQYRVHNNSLTGTRQEDIRLRRIRLLESYLANYNVKDADKNKIRVQLAEQYYLNGERQKLKETLKLLKERDREEYNRVGKAARLNCYIDKKIIEMLKRKRI